MRPSEELMKAVMAGLLLAAPQAALAQLPECRGHVALEQGCRAVESLGKYRLPEKSGATVDGQVPDLNSSTFQAFSGIKKSNPNAMTEQDALELKAAILSDQTIDAAELDLLEELVQARFRSINVTEAGQSNSKFLTYPVSEATSRALLKEILQPPLDFDQEWEKGALGYANIVAYCQKVPDKEASVLGFVQRKLAEQWAESNTANAYKPLRDQISKIYGWAQGCKESVPLGRAILYLAMLHLDRADADKVPDFLYNWIRPTGQY